MECGWPDFQEREALGDGRCFTAVFDSYDQYHEVVYYRVTLYEGEQVVAKIMACLDAGFSEPDPRASRERTLRDLCEVARTGRSNTSYTGWQAW